MKFREFSQHTKIELFVILALLIVDSVGILYLIKFYDFSSNIVFFTLIILTTYLSKGYNPSPTCSRFVEIKRLFLSFSIIWIIVTFITILVIIIPYNSFETFFQLYFFSFLWILFSRQSIRFIQRYLLKFDIGLRRVIIIGNDNSAYELIKFLDNNPSLGHKVIGYSADKSNDKIDTISSYLGKVNSINSFLVIKNIHDIIISSEIHSNNELLDIVGYFYNQSVNVKIIPDMYEALSGKVKMNKLNGVALIDVNPQILTEYQKIIKRNLELLISLLALIIMLPVVLIAIPFIKLTSKGGILYKQMRVGMNGKEFSLYKFRTMYENSEQKTGPVWASKDDPRITPIGKFLRKYRIDELPQLINVIKGDMSIVGPRPERPFFVKKLTKKFPFYSRRECVRPGITGWAQVVGEYDTTIENVEEKLKHDFFYIENISIILDLKIMFMTIFILIKGTGR